jgi:peptide/nickel transport system substrate-binding protein
MKLSMKTLTAFLLILTMLFSLTACGNSASSPADNTDKPSTSAPESSGTTFGENKETAAKDEVVIGFTSVPSNYDPLNGFYNGVQILYSALVQTNANMEVVADLAADYNVGDDALTYNFTLREGAKFSNGTAITAEDVVFSFETAKANASSLDLSKMESISANGNDITIQLSKPDSTFILTVCNVGIVPKASYGEDFALNPISSGPYKLVQYDVDQQFILEANEHYYGTAPGISRVVFVKMADQDTRLMAVQSGQVDITLTSAVVAANNSVNGYYLLQEETVDNFGIAMPYTASQDEVNEYGYPVGNDFTSDITIRKALAYGLDRQKVCEEALNGYGVPAYSENDGMPWYNPESEIEYNLEYAQQLLTDAGWVDTDGDGIREKDGVKASTTLLYSAGDDVRQTIAMAVSNQVLENLGIEMIVEGVGWEDLPARMYSEPLILAWGSSNPKTSYMLYHSSNAGKEDWYNPENFASEVVDSYLDAAIGAKTLEEAIPFWQKAQWDGETGTSMRGECSYIFILNKTHLYWAREGLDTGDQKIHAHGDAWPLVQNVAQWKWN